MFQVNKINQNKKGSKMKGGTSILLKPMNMSISKIEDILKNVSPIEKLDIYKELGDGCSLLGLDPLKITLFIDINFKKNKSIFDNNPFDTLGTTQTTGNSYFDIRHTIKLDKSIKDNYNTLIHTLYHELGHCYINEQTKLLKRQQVYKVWNEGLAELISFICILQNKNLRNPETYKKFQVYKEFINKQKFLDDLRYNIIKERDEVFDYSYIKSMWILFDKLIDKTFPNIQELVTNVIITNCNGTEWNYKKSQLNSSNKQGSSKSSKSSSLTKRITKNLRLDDSEPPPPVINPPTISKVFNIEYLQTLKRDSLQKIIEINKIVVKNPRRRKDVYIDAIMNEQNKGNILTDL
jgi:hypothetical protein